MYHWIFLWRLNQKRILQAIREAEQRSSGEIRVFVSHKKCSDPMVEAQAQFVKLNMHATQQRNSVLILVAPRTRTFAIYADSGIYAVCEPQVWEAAASKLSQALAADLLTQGIIEAVQSIAEVLAQRFPRQPGDSNELPDEVLVG
jgi:uncharacterized membrane protein